MLPLSIYFGSQEVAIILLVRVFTLVQIDAAQSSLPLPLLDGLSNARIVRIKLRPALLGRERHHRR